MLQCCCHPYIYQGAPNNLSPIYCQMVVNFIVYLYKRPKLLISDQGILVAMNNTDYRHWM